MFCKKTTLTGYFNSVTVTPVEHISVQEGAVFTLHLNHYNYLADWFSDDDPVLDIEISKSTHSAKIRAFHPGNSKVIVIGKRLQKIISIHVREPQAVSLGLSFGEPR